MAAPRAADRLRHGRDELIEAAETQAAHLGDLASDRPISVVGLAQKAQKRGTSPSRTIRLAACPTRDRRRLGATTVPAPRACNIPAHIALSGLRCVTTPRPPARPTRRPAHRRCAAPSRSSNSVSHLTPHRARRRRRGTSPSSWSVEVESHAAARSGRRAAGRRRRRARAASSSHARPAGAPPPRPLARPPGARRDAEHDQAGAPAARVPREAPGSVSVLVICPPAAPYPPRRADGGGHVSASTGAASGRAGPAIDGRGTHPDHTQEDRQRPSSRRGSASAAAVSASAPDDQSSTGHAAAARARAV